MSLSICVFCASSDSIDGVYRDAAKDLARELAAHGMTLVYGGGNNGLMGVLSGEMHESGGTLVGVIPRRLVELGFAFDRADEMIVTDGMRERKAIMEERADGFIGLPGGFGTLEEMLEILTLRQLGMLDKPIVFLDVNDFFRGLLVQFETAYRERFVSDECRGLYFVTGSVGEAVGYIRSHAKIRTSSLD